MSKKFLWLLGPIFVLALAGCGETDDDDDTDTSSTDDTSTTDGTTDDTEVSLAIGSGSGTSFRSGALSSAIGSAELSAGGETTITASIVDTDNSNALYTGEVITVSFTSGCVEAEKASLSNTSVATSSGTATVTYTAQGCLDDTVVASVSNSSGTASASVGISIATAEVNAISFTGTDFNPSIAFSDASTTSLPSFTTIEFKLYDKTGFAVEGQDVSFNISAQDTNHGATLSVVEDTSDENGRVSTILNAGTSAANLRVSASFTTTGGTEVFTQSLPIAINTGVVDSENFNLSVSAASVANAYNVDGVQTTFTVRLADHNNNLVADGTIVSFEAEYGAIEATCKTTAGTCSAKWTSGGERPKDGLATVIAYTTGEDTFFDSGPQNGVYNVSGEMGLAADEGFLSKEEVYFDYNFDGYSSTSFTDAGSGEVLPSDKYFDYNNSGSFEASSSRYRGARCSQGAEALGHCSETSIQVWDHTQIALNTVNPQATLRDGTSANIENEWPEAWNVDDYEVLVTDLNGNFPPNGTTVSVSALGDAEAEIEVIGSVPLVGQSSAVGYIFSVIVSEVTVAGRFKLLVSFPGGGTATYFVNVS